MIITTKETICDEALALLGTSEYIRGSSSPASQACDRFFAAALNEVLSCGRWSFAMRRETLMRNIGSATCRYMLPADCIILIDVPLDCWTLEEGYVVITTGNAPKTIDIKYISSQASIDIADPLFLAALANKLASKIALIVTGSHELRIQLNQEYERALLPKALHVNVVQDRSNDQHPLQALLNQSLLSRWRR